MPERTKAWAVHKFGGTSIADAHGIAEAARLVTAERDSERVAVVVSAMAGVTDALIEAIDLAARDGGFAAALSTVVGRTEAAARALLAGDASEVIEAVRADASDIEDVLKGVRVARTRPRETVELVSGFGELWSARMLCAHLARAGMRAAWLDAREVLVVDRDATGPVVDWEASSRALAAWLDRHDSELVVITGYIASDRDGVPTTLGRNGSDFSASIFAKLLGAGSITIWTDVDGVLSADPTRVPEAVVLPALSYQEAMELAYFGAAVLHPHTMAPAFADGIPIRIRNARRAELPGTLISAARGDAGRETSERSAVKGFSLKDGIALLNVEGAAMIGVPGIASRLFTALRDVGVSVTMISQASSEHSICVAVPDADGERGRAAVEAAFASELLHGQIQTVELSRPHSILAAVGDNMVETPGVSARLFGALGKAGVSVRAVAQGSSERNISAVVAARDAARALRAAHAGFYLSDQTISVGLVGPGLIGAELLRQLGAQAEALRSRFQIDLRVRGVASSRSMVLDEAGIDPGRHREELAERGTPVDLAAFADHVRAAHLPHAVIVDCTASAAVAERYAGWLARGIHVVTANKLASSGPLGRYLELRELGRRTNAHYLYEATVGAGLPVVTTLRDLIQTGDRVARIEGVLSGTLSYVLNSFTGEEPFSAIAAEARRRGYTEPDPREDLSGVDVARKALILARELGIELELDDVPIEGLVPDALRETSDPEAFLRGLADYDADMERLREAADRDGEVLRYVAVVTADGRASVGLRRYPAAHAFARVTGGDNIIAFTTARYHEQPLIVQGPGAGPEVTAGGVFGDLLRLASYLGAPA